MFDDDSGEDSKELKEKRKQQVYQCCDYTMKVTLLVAVTAAISHYLQGR